MYLRLAAYLAIFVLCATSAKAQNANNDLTGDDPESQLARKLATVRQWPQGVFVRNIYAMTRKEETAIRKRFPPKRLPNGMIIKTTDGPPPLNNSGFTFNSVKFPESELGKWAKDPDPTWRMIALSNITFTSTQGGPRDAAKAVMESLHDKDKAVRERARWVYKTVGLQPPEKKD